MRAEQSIKGGFYQQGMVLIVGLVMVLLITIIGLAAIRGSGLQESMAGNMRDRNIAFQAAESALRVGESLVSPENILPVFACLSQSGLCEDLNSNIPEKSLVFWDKSDWNGAASLAKQVNLGMKNVSTQPSYIIELLEIAMNARAEAEGSGVGIGSVGGGGGTSAMANVTPFRITAQGVGITADSIVVVQSTYLRPGAE
ncbi:pilus assembly PilX family protein [Cellvibrio japonicus]|uniref:pilus assembly PilX family protein n=1 Tax=Cellvibrio japonicus TaxID=155077 RepID=UPI000673D34F|nr:PilX N-terminal domain-containing pilus assembly protein [Cellvibrio japonicus]